ncbi:tetratricopeptide repeat protein [Effusibacillus pohliae]|uniref:tetratricopeptide repeat protein n=1 Tax=Effusibacillus pohliae TaxID=232270 RepID=UPI00036247C7|nr:tetratricopeptide repeat protein [Effusibacillus pohliae]
MRMFDKPFEQLFRALQRIEQQLMTAGPDEKRILREELIALRSVCDRFVEKWLSFEEKIAALSEFFGLDIDVFETPKPQAPPLPTKQADMQPVPVLPKPDEEQMIRSFRKGLGYFDLLMFPDAIRELERVVELDQQFTVARLYLAFGYVGKREYDKAKQHLNRVAAEANDPFLLAAVHHTYGHLYAENGDFARAAEEFKQAAESMQDLRDVFFNLGVCQYNQKQYHDALASFLVALEQNPDDWEAERIVSLLWQKLGSPDKAYEHIEKAYKLNSSNCDILVQFADLALQRGQYDLARALYNKARAFYPAAARPFGGLGWLAMREAEFGQAMLYFKKQLTLAPSDLQAKLNLGWAALLGGDIDKADEVFALLLAEIPDSASVKIGMARVLQMRNKQEEAHRLLQSVVQLNDPQDRLLGHMQIGRLALEQGNYAAAIEQFAQALQLDGNCIEGWFYKALAHTGLGETDAADQCWQRCRQATAKRMEASV